MRSRATASARRRRCLLPSRGLSRPFGAGGRAVADGAVRTLKVEFPEEALDDLRTLVAATHWPEKETVEDDSQGVQLATMQELTRYWASEYDWRKCEARLNALPQFKAELDGVDIHFIRVKSPHENALPLIITHGWPGSVVELLAVVDPLIDPTTHGGRAEDAFDLVLPSLPGFGFSEQPASVGWDPGRVAQVWAKLMNRLGYTRYVAQGGDLGAAVTDALAIQAPDGLVGIHLNFLRRPPPAVAAAVFGSAPAPAGPAGRLHRRDRSRVAGSSSDRGRSGTDVRPQLARLWTSGLLWKRTHRVR